MNIKSLNEHFDELQVFLQTLERKPIAICLSETWLKNSAKTAQHIRNYHKPISQAFVNKASGVTVYIRKDCRCQPILISTQIENVTVMVTGKNTNKFILCCIYNSPSLSKDILLQDIDKLLTKLGDKCIPVYVVGDMNLDLLKQWAVKEKYLETLQYYGFEQLIKEPTRVQQDSKTLVDHVLVKSTDEDKIQSGVIKTTITDHYSTFVKLPFVVNTNSVKKKKLTFLTDDEQKVKFLSELKALINEEEILATNVQDGTENVLEKIISVSANYTKEYSKSSGNSKPPWYSNFLKNQILKRDKHYQSYLKNKTIENEVKYKDMKRKVKKLLQSAKKEYYGNLFRLSIADKRVFFKKLNHLVKEDRNNAQIQSVIYKGEEFFEDATICEKFNEYYVNVAANLLRDLEPINAGLCKEALNDNAFSMFLKPTNPAEVSKIISGLRNNKTPGFDGITAEVLKLSNEILSPVLSELINRSFERGIFPDCLKLAKVTPIPKSGNDREVSNFRPISILPVISKVFERAMYTRVYHYFERFHLFKSSQFGYRRKRSTVDAIIQIIEKVRDDDQFLCNCLFLDLSKAFDTLDHERLIMKLERYGVRGPASKWFESYLEGRKQFVQINDAMSQSKVLNTGVPQGSILGPLLFLIYMNDLENICTFLFPTFFADDTNLRISTSKGNYNEDQINDELSVIEEWFKMNKLILNGSKTKRLSFRSRLSFPLFLQKSPLEETDSLKYLGVTLDKNLNFDEHIKDLSRKLGKHIAIVSRLRHFVTREVLLDYYMFYVKPVIQYGILVYGGTYFGKLEKISILQRKFFRLLFFKRYTDNIDAQLCMNNVLTVKQLYFYEIVKFALRSIRKELPTEDTNNMFVRKDHTQNTRSAFFSSFVLPLANNNWKKFSLKYRGSRVLNFLTEMRLIPSDIYLKTPHQIEDLIHNIKDFLKNLPDHAVEDILR